MAKKDLSVLGENDAKNSGDSIDETAENNKENKAEDKKDNKEEKKESGEKEKEEEKAEKNEEAQTLQDDEPSFFSTHTSIFWCIPAIIVLIIAIKTLASRKKYSKNK